MMDAGSTSAATCGIRLTIIAVLLLLPQAVLAQDAGDAQPGAVLRWGGDASGGDPYISEREGGEPGGFEGDLAQYLAKKLGTKSAFGQREWDKLPLFLDNKSIDLVLNGYEWTPERAKAMLSTIPYYVYRLRLLVKKGSPIRDWSDLKAGVRVGVLKDSTSETYLTDNFPDVKVLALSEEGSTGVMRMVVNGQLEATVQDDPVVSWYLGRKNQFPALEVVGEPVAPNKTPYYVIYVRKDDTALRDRLNAALREGLEDGTLRRIYSQYGLWSDEEGELLAAGRKLMGLDDTQGTIVEETGLTWKRFFGDLAAGTVITVLLTLASMPLAMLVGLLAALGRVYGPRWLGIPLAVYVEVIRGTPVMFQLMILFFFIPAVTGVQFLPPFWTGVFGLAINYGAYEAENYRAGLLAIPRGQMEAALALGMSKWTALRRVIVPQAVRLVIPPVTNDFISLFKDTSICSAIGVTELLARWRTLTVQFPESAGYTLLVAACLYLLMSYPLSLLARRIEARQGKGMKPVQ